MVRFSSDGRVLVMAANAILQVRDTTHWGLVSSRSVFPAPLYSIGICPTDNRVAAGFADGTIEIWAADLTTLRRLPGHKDLVYSLDWSFDGLLLASGGDSTAKIWIIQG
jgi:ribosome assembly protein 4